MSNITCPCVAVVKASSHAVMEYGEEAHLVEDPDEMKLTPGIVKCEQQP